MHMADALVSPTVAAVMYASSSVATLYSIKKIKEENDPKKIPLMGVMGAFVFAAQMVNYTIPGTGSSGHLCGGFLLSALLGPYAGFVTMVSVLLIQALLFADGGLLALGCNIWNMSFFGCFLGTLLVWKPMMKQGINKGKIIAASIIGCILTLQLGSFSVTLETMASNITSLPFLTFAATMQPIHLAIGFVEGCITAVVLVFVYEARPELLWGYDDAKKEKLKFKKILAIFGVLSILVGGGLSLAASSNPDGLEWSIQRITGSTEMEASSATYDTADSIQNMTAIFPDYSFRNSDSFVGKASSGIIGCCVIFFVCYGSSYFAKSLIKKRIE